MARIRTIKPQFWLDEELGSIKRDARLLYIGLWNICDDHGVFEYKPGKIRVQIFPYDSDIDNQGIVALLNILEQSGHVKKLTDNGESFGFIPTFEKHQQIKKPSQWSFTNSKEGSARTGVKYPTSTPPVPHQLPSSSYREKEKEKEKEKYKDKGKGGVGGNENGFVLPDWIDKGVWGDFMEVRRKLKAAPTLKAKQLLIKDLENYKAAGDAPVDVLNQSIKNSWKGLFPIKKGGNDGQFKQNPRTLPKSYTKPEDYGR